MMAVHYVIEARRTELRHGTLNMVRASLNGFRALPPPGVDWRAVLNIKGPITKESVQETYRRLAAERHPDRPGGSHSMMAAARDLALREVAP